VDEDIIIPIAGMIFVIVIVLGIPLIRAMIKRWERESTLPKVPAEVAARLERMEQSIDAMAIEMERISEGQRFVTKILADRQVERVPLPGARDAERA